MGMCCALFGAQSHETLQIVAVEGSGRLLLDATSPDGTTIVHGRATHTRARLQTPRTRMLASPACPVHEARIPARPVPISRGRALRCTRARQVHNGVVYDSSAHTFLQSAEARHALRQVLCIARSSRHPILITPRVPPG